mmetsp:Transcript_14052/g.42532  ORF Transcript_14052/g.42532 Transcript_14052/m.42532 type:complete len:212 (-) Transcript_14052:2134-2769(-)
MAESTREGSISPVGPKASAGSWVKPRLGWVRCVEVVRSGRARPPALSGVPASSSPRASPSQAGAASASLWPPFSVAWPPPGACTSTLSVGQAATPDAGSGSAQPRRCLAALPACSLCAARGELRAAAPPLSGRSGASLVSLVPTRVNARAVGLRSRGAWEAPVVTAANPRCADGLLAAPMPARGEEARAEPSPREAGMGGRGAQWGQVCAG